MKKPKHDRSHRVRFIVAITKKIKQLGNGATNTSVVADAVMAESFEIFYRDRDLIREVVRHLVAETIGKYCKESEEKMTFKLLDNAAVFDAHRRDLLIKIKHRMVYVPSVRSFKSTHLLTAQQSLEAADYLDRYAVECAARARFLRENGMLLLKNPELLIQERDERSHLPSKK